MIRGMLILALVSGVGLFPATGRAATRVALVGEGPMAALVDLVIANVTDLAEVEWLEREAIRQVLAEQKLSRAGWIDAGQAVTLGKILSADLVARIESPARGHDRPGLVVFDGRTGIRYVDDVLPAGPRWDAAVPVIAQHLRTAILKRGQGANPGKTIAILGVRNADLPRSHDGIAEALGLLIERQLIRSPDLAVLERRRLELLNRERELAPGQAAPVLATVTLLELELARDGDRGLRAMAHFRGLPGVPEWTVDARDEEGDVAKLAQRVAAAIAAQSGAAPGTVLPDRRSESTRFSRECEHHLSHLQMSDAVRTAEAAWALNPQDPAIADQLSMTLLRNAVFLFSPSEATVTKGGDTGWVDTPVSPESLQELLTQAERSLELRDSAAASHPNFAFSQRLCLLCDRLRGYATSANISSGQRQELHAFLQTCLRRSLAAHASAAARAATNPDRLDGYTTSLSEHLAVIVSAARDSDEYTRSLVQVVSLWNATTQLWTPQSNRTDGADAFLILMRAFVVPPVWPRAVDPVVYVRQMEPVFQQLEHHPRPVVRLFGIIGRIRAAVLLKIQPEQSCYADFVKQFRPLAESCLRSPEPWHPERTRYAAYEAWRIAIDTMPGATAARFRREEVDALCDVMLQRGDVSYKILQLAFENLDRPAAYRRSQQAFAVLESDRYPGPEPERVRIRSFLQTTQQRLLKEQPDLATSAESPPWTRATKLYDMRDFPGLSDLLAGQFLEDDLCLVFLQFQQDEPGLRLAWLRPGQPLELKSWVPLGLRQEDVAPHRRPELIKGLDWDRESLVVGTAGAGIVVFSRTGESRRLGTHNGLPSDQIQSVALLDGVIYAGSPEGYLLAHTIQTSQTELLASSRRRQARSPWDDGLRFSVPMLVADRTRNRIVFLAGTTLWEWHPTRREFHPRIDLLKAAQGRSEPKLGADSVSWIGPMRDQHVLLSNAFRVMQLDLEHDQATELHDPGRGIFPIHPPQLVVRDEMWSGASFSRLQLTTRTHTRLPEPDSSAGPFRATCFLELTPRHDAVIAAGPYAVWRFELPPPVPAETTPVRDP